MGVLGLRSARLGSVLLFSSRSHEARGQTSRFVGGVGVDEHIEYHLVSVAYFIPTVIKGYLRSLNPSQISGQQWGGPRLGKHTSVVSFLRLPSLALSTLVVHPSTAIHECHSLLLFALLSSFPSTLHSTFFLLEPIPSLLFQLSCSCYSFAVATASNAGFELNLGLFCTQTPSSLSILDRFPGMTSVSHPTE